MIPLLHIAVYINRNGYVFFQNSQPFQDNLSKILYTWFIIDMCLNYITKNLLPKNIDHFEK